DLAHRPASLSGQFGRPLLAAAPTRGYVRDRAVVRPAPAQVLVIARATDDQDPVRDPAMMPWALTRRELDAMAADTPTARSVEKFLDDEDPPKLRWRAEFTRA